MRERSGLTRCLPIVFFWSLCCLSFDLWLLITSLCYFQTCLIFPLLLCVGFSNICFVLLCFSFLFLCRLSNCKSLCVWNSVYTLPWYAFCIITFYALYYTHRFPNIYYKKVSSLCLYLVNLNICYCQIYTIGLNPSFTTCSLQYHTNIGLIESMTDNKYISIYNIEKKNITDIKLSGDEGYVPWVNRLMFFMNVQNDVCTDLDSTIFWAWCFLESLNIRVLISLRKL